MSGMFNGCVSLKELKITELNVDRVIDKNYMFYECPKTIKDKARTLNKNLRKEAFYE